METITLTFGDCGENHVGMQKIGKISAHGYSLDDLLQFQQLFDLMGAETEILDLSINEGKAYLLIVRKGIDALLKGADLSADQVFEEQKKLTWDTKAFMYGRVVNKLARHNLCYDEKRQSPDYENKKGTIVAWDDIPVTKELRDGLSFITDTDLIGEGNRYYDVTKCGIGFHGDTERRRVIGCRLGASMNLQYQWFYKGETVGDRIEVTFDHGDLYVMSEKAVGFDWKLRNTHTLRHAAGAAKFTNI